MLLWFLVSAAVLSVLYKYILVKTSPPRFAEYWQRRRTLAGEIRYVALGNSAAQGVGAVAPELGYVGLIAEYMTNTTTVQVINLSVSGARVRDVHAQIAQIPRDLDSRDLITVDIGSNDITPEFNPLEFETGMRQVLQKVSGSSSATVVMADLPFFGAFGGDLEVHVKEANQILHSVAAEFPQVRIAPVHKYTETFCRFPWYYALDFFHPSTLGYQVWFQAFRSRL